MTSQNRMRPLKAEASDELAAAALVGQSTGGPEPCARVPGLLSPRLDGSTVQHAFRTSSERRISGGWGRLRGGPLGTLRRQKTICAIYVRVPKHALPLQSWAIISEEKHALPLHQWAINSSSEKHVLPRKGLRKSGQGICVCRTQNFAKIIKN